LHLLIPAAFVATFVFATADVSPEGLQEAGHWKQLRSIVELRVAANANDAEAAYLLSCVKSAFGDVDGALGLAERAVTLDPGNSRYHLQLAIANGEKAGKVSFFSAMRLGGRYKSEVQKAIDLDPKNLDARISLMEFHIHAPGIAGGDKEKARMMADEIVSMDPARGYMALAEIAEVNKQPADVEHYLRKAAEADPKDYSAQAELAWLYLSDEQKKYDVAEKYAHRAIALDPARVSGHSALARAYAQQERWKDLDSELAEAEKNVPDDLTPYFRAGMELLLTGKDTARVERYFRKYLSQEPEGRAPRLSHAYWHLGQALAKQGKKTEAITEIETALRMEPSLEGAKSDLKRLK
jgi:tetratricopeptide (TPR) repeat protein